MPFVASGNRNAGSSFANAGHDDLARAFAGDNRACQRRQIVLFPCGFELLRHHSCELRLIPRECRQ